MSPEQGYWNLEAEICRIAGSLGLRKDDMLADPDNLPEDIRTRVEELLWCQVKVCEVAENKAKRRHLKVI